MDGQTGPWCLVPQLTLLQPDNYTWDPELSPVLRENIAPLARGWCLGTGVTGPGQRSRWRKRRTSPTNESQGEAESDRKGY